MSALPELSTAPPASAANPWRRAAVFCLAAALVVFALTTGGLLWFARSWQGGGGTRRAPLFTLPDQAGHPYRLSDYLGRPVVLAFYPRLDSASQAGLRSLRDAMRDFDMQGVKVIGISREAPAGNREFHAREKLSFPLLTDADGKVAATYGVTPKSAPDGRAGFIISPRGRVLESVFRLQPERQGEQLLMLTLCCLGPGGQEKSRLMGKPVADMPLSRVEDGREESLYAGRPAKATVLFFVSAHCPCSRGYDARLREIARIYGPQGVRCAAVNAAAGETREEMARHAREAAFGFPMLRDEKGRLADRLGARVTPEVFVMDARGVLRYHGRVDDDRNGGRVHSHDLRNALDALVAERLPVTPETPAFGCAIPRAAPTGSSGRP